MEAFSETLSSIILRFKRAKKNYFSPTQNITNPWIEDVYSKSFWGILKDQRASVRHSWNLFYVSHVFCWWGVPKLPWCCLSWFICNLTSESDDHCTVNLKTVAFVLSPVDSVGKVVDVSAGSMIYTLIYIVNFHLNQMVIILLIVYMALYLHIPYSFWWCKKKCW